jgi:dihydroorotase
MTGHHTAPHVIRDDRDLDQIFAIAAEKGLPITVHAEDDATLELFRQTQGAPADLIEYEQSLPRSAAIIAAGKLLACVRRHGTQLHVLHVSTAEEAELYEAAATQGLPVTFETTPHQLWFNRETALPLGALAKLSPAIRGEGDRCRLWDAVLSGALASIGSDHAPHTLAEKSRGLAGSPPGMPGVQEMLSVVMTGLRACAPGLTLDEIMSRIVGLLADGPARLFRLAHRKGSLTPGLDADVTIFDSTAVFTLVTNDLLSLCGWSPYESVPLAGKVLTTLLRGETIYEDGRFTRSPNGRLVDFAERGSDRYREMTTAPFYTLV